MTLMKHLGFALFVLLLIPNDGLTAQDSHTGDWYGVLTTPVGDLRVIVTITLDETGELRAEIESPDQAPGRKIPVTTVRVTADSLTFSIQPISASYEGVWEAAEQQWTGFWTQGGRMPLVLTREIKD